MSSQTLTRPNAPVRPAQPHHVPTRLIGAALALGIAYLHVKDQGGFPGDKAPTYVGVGYYLLEAVGLVIALALLAGAGRHTAKLWYLAAGVALGPIVGFVLSRGPGLPDYTDDKGNWTETLGLVSLATEGGLLVLAALVLTRSRRTAV